MKDSLLVDKSVLPLSFLLVYKTKELIEEKKMSVSDACKEIGISRSTYYKYCDHIFTPPKKTGKRSIFLVQVDNVYGALSDVLNKIAEHNCNIITINQDTPVTEYAYITVMIDTLQLNLTIDELVTEMLSLPKTKNVTVLASE
ncbi:MAG: ACT domain-containing protein [Anaeroplasmataceae bacterium]